MKKTPGKKAALSKYRWLTYATAGAASAFTGSPHADGEIHYSGLVFEKFGSSRTKVADEPLAAGASLEFSRMVDGNDVSNRVGLVGAEVNSIRGTSVFASKLYRGDRISQGSFINVNVGPLPILVSASNAGNFSGVGVGYIGFKFDTGAGTQYGWARIKTAKDHKFILLDYAYGDPGDAIVVGLTDSAREVVSTVPAAGSLGALALGGAGLLAWRNRRAQSL